MSQRASKLRDRLRQHPNNTSFDDLDTLLRLLGYELRRVNGSHHIYSKKGFPPINVTRHGAQVHKDAVDEVVSVADQILEDE